MRTIPKEFNKHGYRYTLVSRIGEIAIYSQEKGTHRNFEVMVIRKHKYDNDFTGRKAGDEYLPSPEEWGTYGWTLTTYEAAVQKAKTIEQFNQK
ncbi:hypothetical protein [Akkermansia muciniphila]|jgi:hypothetical protein|uniref:hypothetical protein n=1 Tax=Akkermansia muciniphila TaxID=239935 RepID=UPI000C9B9E05|nr:hypothetical protein [Akkermansia muciniphila]PNC89839.1 hypothetical protein CXT91_09820 [Akkermansia muciniphila]